MTSCQKAHKTYQGKALTWIAVVGCVYADNSLLPGGLYHVWFTEVNDQDAKSAHFDKGYMTDELAFVVATKECA